jgi:hypothetical protein
MKNNNMVQEAALRIITGSSKLFAVTGTKHGSLVEADSEGEARRAFHTAYNGESIIACKPTSYAALFNS